MSTSIGYTCSCGHENIYDSYCFAHWHHVLTGRCENCKRKTKVCRGQAWPAYRRKGEKIDCFKTITKPCPSKKAHHHPSRRRPTNLATSPGRKRQTSRSG